MKKKIGIIALIFLIAFIGFNYYSNMQKIEKLESKVNQLNNKIELNQKENDKLSQHLNNLDDPEFVEKIARTKLGLVKPGEVLVIPVEENSEEE